MKIRKIILLVITLILSFSVFACKKDDGNSELEEKLESIINGVIIEKEYRNLVGDFVLPDTAGGSYFITWSIDEKYAANAVIAYDDNGMPYIDITQAETSVQFDLVATIEEGGVSANKSWECWIAKIRQPSVVKCDAVYNASNDDYLQITGVVTCVGKNQGYWVKDETATVYVYDQGANGVSAGDTVTVKGYKDKYHSIHQITEPAIVEKTSGTFDAKANATVSSVVELDAIVDEFVSTNSLESSKKFGSIYTIEGKITKNTNNGIKYDYLITDPLTGKFVVLYEKYMSTEIQNAVKDNLNKYVEATVVYWDVYSDGNYGRFAPVAVTAKTEPTYTDEQYVNATEVLLKDQIPSETDADLNLITSNSFANLTITWTSSNEAVLSSAGKIGTSSNETEEVTLTAVITLGEASKTVEFKVEVSFTEEN